MLLTTLACTVEEYTPVWGTFCFSVTVTVTFGVCGATVITCSSPLFPAQPASTKARALPAKIKLLLFIVFCVVQLDIALAVYEISTDGAFEAGLGYHEIINRL